MNAAAKGAAEEEMTRWEWRVFGDTLPLERAELRELVTGPERASADCYLVSAASPHNAKLRHGLLEIKRLEETHPTGLERWRPVLRAPFPLHPAAIGTLYTLLAISGPQPTGPLADEAALIASLPDIVRVVRVDKSRVPLAIEGCPGEWVQLLVDDLPIQSLSLEHLDPQRLLAALRSRGLNPAANTSYPAALLRLVTGGVTVPSPGV